MKRKVFVLICCLLLCFLSFLPCAYASDTFWDNLQQAIGSIGVGPNHGGETYVPVFCATYATAFTIHTCKINGCCYFV